MKFIVTLKRSLIPLIATIAFSFKGFSQTDTKIVLSEPVAKMVVKDLVSYDGLSKEYQILKRQLATLDDKVVTLQEVIDNLKLQLDNRQSIIDKKDEQIVTYSDLSESLQKALRRERRTKQLYKVTSIIGLSIIALNIVSP